MRYLVTGGAGFIGCNLVHRLLSRNEQVLIYDDLSRPRVSANLAWLRQAHGETSFDLCQARVQDQQALALAARDADVIVHLAGQTAVTRSVLDPAEDFESNARGTLNVLEAARQSSRDPVLLYASTNKVYGPLEAVPVVEGETRYLYRDPSFAVSENQALDFHSPYGCSKGAGDQYVRDYARIYGLRTVVFRQSCIYGPRQMGLVDQGWLAWFLITALLSRPITICGNGKQVRDILYIDDLLDAYDAAIERIDVAGGQAYNIGGGFERSISVWVEFEPIIERLLGRGCEVSFTDWRPGDQRVYISDTRKAERELDWKPTVDVASGIEKLAGWIEPELDLFSK